ncbi:efflux RND transporter permease subunit [uncultured Hyphomicrobium sp.]|uniref:efflux RND transporter permease subunit n=1 Tax=uncultured Hyphomicrobium sp. TaxID=194373 RepID=UPI0025FBCE79|nr:efflux RND transporter permease subunit [uncultured Hyphomicrobium sp.]
MIFNAFIDRPRLAMVISIIIALAGGMAAVGIPVAQYPNIAPPTVHVSTTYPGADAATVATAIAQPIENAVNGVPGMRYMQSTSTNDGGYSLSITFEQGVDPDTASMNVSNRVNMVLGRMPQEVRNAGLTVGTGSSDLLQIMSFYSDNPEHDQLFLSTFVTLNILDDLKRIPGVGEAAIMGARDYAMRIWIDPQKLIDYNLSTNDIVDAVRAQNIQAPAGRIGAAPIVSSDQRLELAISSKGLLSTPEEFGNIVLRSHDNGSTTRLKDVARIEVKAASYNAVAQFDGRPAAPVAINLAAGANAVSVADAVAEKLDAMRSRLPQGVHFAFIYDTSDFVSAMIDRAIETLFEAFILVAIVVYVFLGRLRPSLIPLIAVPVSIIGAFLILVPLGYSANTISLLALVLAIGIVVDDSIIVVENVEREMEENPGLSAADATRKAMGQIIGPIVAVTLVLLSVFVPVAFLPGSTGILFQQFAATISAAMVFSAINAVTLTPALCALLLKPQTGTHAPNALQAVIERWSDRYAGVIEKVAGRSIAGIAAVAMVGLFAGYIFWDTPKGFLPQEDKGYLLVVSTLPPAASLNRTEAAVAKVTDIVKKDPAVESTLSIVGLDFLTGGSASNSGIMFVRLKPYEQRKSPELQADDTAMRLFMALSTLPEGTFVALNPPSLPGAGSVGGFEYILEGLEGQNPSDLAAAARALSVAAQKKPELSQVFSGAEAQVPQINLEIDRERARLLGLDPGDIYNELQSMLGGRYVTDFNKFGRTWTVQIQADAGHRADLDDLSRIHVKNRDGHMVPISLVAKATLGVGPSSLARYNNYPSVTVRGSAAPNIGDSRAIEAMEELSDEVLPKGFKFEWTGQALEEKVSAAQTPLVISLALLFAFFLLVGLYESWSMPLVALLPVTIAVLGALLGLFVTQSSLLIYTEIGIIVLIALAAKNSILMTQFFIDQRQAGKSIVEAAIAGARQRIRPVMMTSVAFIAALVPLLIAKGPGEASMYAVALPVFAGMLAASVIGIFFIPVMYVAVQRLREHVRPAARKEAAPEPALIPGE